jgi:hypothetical protein
VIVIFTLTALMVTVQTQSSKYIIIVSIEKILKFIKYLRQQSLDFTYFSASGNVFDDNASVLS